MYIIREYVEDKIVKIIFVNLKDNEADIFMKDVAEELHKKAF